MPISIRLTMLCLSSFELYSRWVPLLNKYADDKEKNLCSLSSV